MVTKARAEMIERNKLEVLVGARAVIANLKFNLQ